ncbi:ABC transporter related [Hydrogenobaculum sp. Y04AAS1]|uniref:ATP-binding cassette domain-containing protein n=1 Tax=Hydrogenobaculum sp. (strain Y04AAS1) TaxID=380749 RepID=UPI00015BC6A9|nr:ABC transporter related [Hydrogenobaculum sp. Y04AAS1]HCT67073.1 ABC transporter ATP-binding protein [Hydrogenobaculum sp.]
MEDKKISIRVQNLTRCFGTGEAKTCAVKNVSLDIYYGEMLYIVGPSGSGKTTFLSLISGVLRPDNGKVIVKDTDIWSLDTDSLARFRLNNIGFVFQDYHLFPRLSVLENVAIPLVLKGEDWDKAINLAKEKLQMAQLPESKYELPAYKLSGGEQQRVAIARALATNPTILALDEPTAALDGDTGKKVMQLIKERMLTPERTILVITHDSRIFEDATRIVHMEDGVIKEASLDEIH